MGPLIFYTRQSSYLRQENSNEQLMWEKYEEVMGGSWTGKAHRIRKKQENW